MRARNRKAHARDVAAMPPTRAFPLLIRNLVFVALCVLGAGGAAAQSYPPSGRIVVAFGPGGIADTIARLVPESSPAASRSRWCGHRTGAGGAVGARITAGRAPDGYTLLVTTAAVAVNANAAKAPLEPRTQLTPVAHRRQRTDDIRSASIGHRETLMEYVRNTKAAASAIRPRAWARPSILQRSSFSGRPGNRADACAVSGGSGASPAAVAGSRST